MTFKLLFVLVEGPDDEDFFDKIVKPLFEEKTYLIRFFRHAQRKCKDVIALINSVNSMNADYIYVRDINDAPCITYKKNEIMSEFDQKLTEDKIIVVVKEIEGWYLAGLNQEISRTIGVHKEIKKIRTTDDITKEEFNQLIPKNMPRRIFMQEILRNYDLESAKRRNKSFRYFLNKSIIDKTTYSTA